MHFALLLTVLVFVLPNTVAGSYDQRRSELKTFAT